MLATALYLLTTAFAAEVVDTRNTLNVTGTGEIWVEPDEAVLTLGVRAQRETAGAAFEAAANKMATVNAALATSVPAERIRTSQLSLQPRYDYSDETGTPRLIGYEASATVEIRVDDPTAVGKVLDNAVAAGANEVHGVAWKVEDEDLARQEALDAAVEDAHGNAALVAAQLGVPLGEPIRVTIRAQESMPIPYYMERGDAAMDVDVASMPVRPGEQIYAAQVDVTFAIGEEQPAPVPEVPPEDEPDIPGDPTS